MPTLEQCIAIIPETHRVLIRQRGPRDDWVHDSQWFVHLIPINATSVGRSEQHPNGLSEPSSKGYGPDLISAFRDAFTNSIMKG